MAFIRGNERVRFKKTTRPLARRINSNNLLEKFSRKGEKRTDNDCKVRPFEVDFQIIFYVVQHKMAENDKKRALLQSFADRIQLCIKKSSAKFAPAPKK